MARPIDLARVRRALARLDALAQEHPHLTRGGLPWSDTLDQLEALMPTPARTRMGALRERRKAAGQRQVNVWLDGDAVAALERLRTELGGLSRSEVLARLLGAASPGGAEALAQKLAKTEALADQRRRQVERLEGEVHRLTAELEAQGAGP